MRNDMTTQVERNGAVTNANNRLVRRYGDSRGSVRDLMLRYIKKRERGEMFSPTIREIFRVYHGVDVGMYSHGGCFRPFSFGRNTTIGRYSSIAATAFAATDNHPMHFKSMHGFFFNPALGVVDSEWEFSPLRIGNDVWLGHNSILMPSVSEVGDGAVVAAGAVVNKDVPAYAVMVGNPARVVRYRFDPSTIEYLMNEKWWEHDLQDIRNDLDQYTRAFTMPSNDDTS